MPSRFHAGAFPLAFILSVSLFGSGGLRAVERIGEPPEELDAPLLPVPKLLRRNLLKEMFKENQLKKAKGSARRGGPKSATCDVVPLRQAPDRLPFGPGEKLEFDVRFYGFKTGQISLSMGTKTQIDGRTTYPVRAVGRTQGAASLLGGVDVRMVTWLDPARMLPVRMASRARQDPLLGATLLVREDAVFVGQYFTGQYFTGQHPSRKNQASSQTPAERESQALKRDALSGEVGPRSPSPQQGSDAADELSGAADKLSPRAASRQNQTGGAVTSELKWWRNEVAKKSAITRHTKTDLVDVLGLLYYARSRLFAEGSVFCFTVFHRRTLWRIDGEVLAPEIISSPWGTRAALRVEANVRRVGYRRLAKEATPVTLWVTDDQRRLPLVISTPEGIGTAQAVLARYTPGRRLQRRTSPASLGR